MNQPQPRFTKYLNDVIKEQKIIAEETTITPITVKTPETNKNVVTETVTIPVEIVTEVENIIDVVTKTSSLKETNEISLDTKLILEALNRLIDKVDVLINTEHAEIVIPAPIIKLTIPEGNKNVIKKIIRDEKGRMTHIVEETEDNLLEQPVILLDEEKATKKPSTKKILTKRKSK